MHVTTSSVTVRYDDVLALNAVSLDVKPGTTLAIWGSAGSGKTTLLKALAGLVRPTEGSVHWSELNVASLTAARRRELQSDLGMVFQSDALFDSISVLENVLMPLRKRRVPEGEAQQRALEALTRVGLREAAAKRPESLSGGMKKRCGVARAIVSRPSVLLADDPFTGLDPVNEQSIASLLIEVSAGRTLIVALPDPIASLPVDRLLQLTRGRVA